MDKRDAKPLLVIIAISVLLRVAAAIYLGNAVENLPGTYDQLSYHNLAVRLVGGHGFSFGEPWWPMTAADAPTAHWSFLYTYFLAGVYSLFGGLPVVARLIQAVLVGLLQPYLAFRLGCQVFNRRVGLLAALFTAIYAYFIYYSATLMTEPFYITAILGALSLTLDWAAPGKGKVSRPSVLWRGLSFGLVLGIAILFRQLFLLVVPFLFLWLWCVKRRQGAGSALPGLALSLVVILAMILPYTIFNYNRFGRFVLLNTNAGYAFFWGNHPVYGTRFIPILPAEMGSYQSLIPKELRRLDEAALDQELLRRGIGFVTDEPGRYILLSLSRVPAYFIFWPSAESGLVSNLSRVGSFGVLLPFMLYGLLCAFMEKPWSFKNILSLPRFLLLLFILVYTGIHILTWALIRYRLPVDAVLVIFAGLAVEDLYERLARLRQSAKAHNNV